MRGTIFSMNESSRTSKSKKRVYVRFSKPVCAALESLAEAHGTSLNAEVNTAVYEYLESKGLATLPTSSNEADEEL